MEDLTLKVEKTITAPIEKVFAAWLDPLILAQFMLPMPGMANPAVTNKPIVGGGFEILMQVGEDKVPHTGKYLEISKPNKLVFSWNSPASPDDSVVTINFTRISNEKTKVELNQVKFIDEERRNNHQGGWSNILALLEQALL